MPKYEGYVLDIPNLDAILDDINEQGHEIITSTYAPESQQMIIIVKRGAEIPKPKFADLFKKEEE